MESANTLGLIAGTLTTVAFIPQVIDAMPVIVANGITLVLSLTILFFKIKFR